MEADDWLLALDVEREGSEASSSMNLVDLTPLAAAEFEPPDPELELPELEPLPEPLPELEPLPLPLPDPDPDPDPASFLARM